MAMLRYEPWSLLRQFQNELNNLGYQEAVANDGAEPDQSNVVTSHWRPAVDIREETDRFVILADLPGVDPADIEITMENGVLTLKGERQFSKEENTDSYRRVERSYGSFYRRFSLPDTADAERIEARGKNGVLEIVLPKQAQVQPRKITVQS
ncbi:MAG: Hsp20/alpha crystallin family protein [Gammaproteobacteria bacterium]